MSRRIPGFTAEASLFKSSNKNMNFSYRDPIVSPRILPQVMQDPERPRPVIIKQNCTVVCFYFGGRRQCSLIC
jgi:hypothetical protein